MAAVHQLTYRPTDLGATAVEVLSFDRLRRLDHGWTQRGDFQVLALVDEGRGQVTVDFRTYPLGADTAAWIPPGAVHCWNDIAGLTGSLVLFVPTAPVTLVSRQLAASPHIRPVWTVAADDRPYVRAARMHLEFEARAPTTATTHELRQILLSALIARLAPPRTVHPATGRTFGLFQASVDEHFRTHHDVGFYARTLGFAPRTLTRAVHQATGRTAKMYLVERLVLEAKRLLVHDRLPPVRVAAKLGFADASNFSAFFRTATGTPPASWQRQHVRCLG